MTKQYAVAGPGASSTATKSALALIASANIRPMANECNIGVAGTPNDYGFVFAATRFTGVGTSAGSPPTPQPLDPSDVACVTTIGWTHSGEPTYASNVDLLQVPINARATYRWVAQDGRELKAPATASNGLGFRQLSASTALAMNAAVIFTE